MRAGGYYHWKVAELNQLDRCPNLRGIPVPKGPIAQPSTGELPPKPQQAQQSCRSDEPEVQTSASGGHRGEQLPASMELDDLPQAEDRAGDPSSWYDRSVQEEEWMEANKKLAAEVKRLQKALGRPSSSTVAPGSARPKELKVVYKHVATREPPRGNIASPAIQAFYPTLHHGQWRTLSSQALTMIVEYHTACVTNGFSITSPIHSQEIEEKLPPLVNYTHPAGAGITDVRVQDNKAKSLRVAVWLHWLDMSLSQEEDASRSLVPLRHTQGCLLCYFLAPGTSNLSYEEVLTQVIKENHMELQKMWEHLTSLLQNCNAKRNKYLDELTDLSRELDTTGVDSLRRDIKAKMSIVCTAISKTEATIKRYANRLKECQLREHEAQSRDQDRPASQAGDDVMVESSTEESVASSSSPGHPDSPEVQPQEQADADGTQAASSGGNLTITPEEEKILLGSQTPQTRDSPASETASVTGDLARMCVDTPLHQQPEGGDASMETSPPLSYST